YSMRSPVTVVNRLTVIGVPALARWVTLRLGSKETENAQIDVCRGLHRARPRAPSTQTQESGIHPRLTTTSPREHRAKHQAVLRRCAGALRALNHVRRQAALPRTVRRADRV